MKLARDELTTKTTHDILMDAATDISSALGVDSGTDLAADFATLRSFNNSDIEKKMDESDGEFIKPIVSKMNTWLPRLSVELWKHDDNKEAQREINAALRKALQPKAMLAANDSVEAAMDSEDANNPSASVLDFIRKEQKKLGDKQMIALKQQLRKNY